MTPAAVAGKPAGATVDLGVTLWRLRPSQASDDGARLLVQDAAELTAERIETGAPLTVGDRVRLSIESPTAGFLYVVDREQYADGTMSEPYLIFPTARTRQGDNAVRAGRLIDIPDQQDRPNYFSVRPSRPGQVGELITILVTPTALETVAIGDKPLVLANDLVASWEKSWTAPVQQFALDGGVKRLWTRQEQAAAGDGTRLLKQDDPPPQTIFRLAAKKGFPGAGERPVALRDNNEVAPVPGPSSPPIQKATRPAEPHRSVSFVRPGLTALWTGVQAHPHTPASASVCRLLCQSACCEM